MNVVVSAAPIFGETGLPKFSADLRGVLRIVLEHRFDAPRSGASATSLFASAVGKARPSTAASAAHSRHQTRFQVGPIVFEDDAQDEAPTPALGGG